LSQIILKQIDTSYNKTIEYMYKWNIYITSHYISYVK
jgi:hypothetical protein